MTTSSKFCCFCDEPTDSNDKNIFIDTTSHTNIVIYKIIEEFLDNPIADINFNFIACIKCITKINNYDLAAATYKSAQQDMIRIIELAESKFQCLLEEFECYAADIDTRINVLNEPEITNECISEDDLFIHENEQSDVLNEPEILNKMDQVNEENIKNNKHKKHKINLQFSEKELNKFSYKKKSKIDKNFCIPCNVNLTNRRYYIAHCKTKRHKNIVNGILPYKCQDCGKQLFTETGLKDHITYFHTTERKYLCTICKKHFATGNLLCYHRNRVHPDAFRCRICQKRFTSSYLTMEEHIDYVHNNKPVECTECNIKYKNLHSLYQHRKAVHINLRLYQCELCGKKFNENNALKNHIKFTHEKIKNLNFKCNICDFKTTTKSVLVRHHRIHTGEKKYNCHICGKNYVAKYNLERHIKTLHNMKKENNQMSSGQ